METKFVIEHLSGNNKDIQKSKNKSSNFNKWAQLNYLKRLIEYINAQILREKSTGITLQQGKQRAIITKIFRCKNK